MFIFAAAAYLFFTTLPEGDCSNPEPFTDLRHCSFAGFNSPNVDLRGTKLDRVDLTNAKITDCDLTGASLKGANLSWANLGGCRVVEANLDDAELFHTTFDGGILNYSSFKKANMFGANLNKIKASLTDSHLSELIINSRQGFVIN